MRDWQKFFTAEDFDKTVTMGDIEKYVLTITGKPSGLFGSLAHDVYMVIANKANAILREELSKAKMVWKIQSANAWGENESDWRSDKLTHTALLVDVKEILE